MTQSSKRPDAGSDLFPSVTYPEWRKRVEAELAGADFASELTIRLPEGVTIEPLYTASHPLGTPPWLLAPMVRAPSPAPPDGDAASGRRWQLVQSFDEPDLRRLRQSLHEGLAGGATGMRLRLDRAARLGGEARTLLERAPSDGAAIATLADWERSFGAAGAQARTWMLDAGGNFLPAAALLLAWRRRSGRARNDHRWLLGADPLAALAREGSLPGALESLQRDLAGLVRHSEAEPASTRALAVSAEVYREAGADAAQELGFALATAAHYLRALEAEGIAPEAAARQMMFQVAVGQDLFTEIAKLRALRRLWDGVLRACGVERPPPAWVHAGVLRRALPSRDPWTNLLRVTVAGFAAVVGGADSLETPAVDTGLSESARRRGRRLARNTQHILAAECHLGRVIDPGAGAYYLEHLTAAVARRGWQTLQSVESAGGILAALRSGWVHQLLGARGQRHRPPVAAAGGGPPVDRRAAAAGRPAPPGGEHQEASPSAGGAGVEGPLAIPADDGRARLEACVEAAARGASLAQLARALYGDGDSATVAPLAPRGADEAGGDAIEETSP